ncbi:glycosyltransferase family 2 protein [Patescibacteria group bacterium]
MQSKVSIIIINYNGMEFIPACLESVKNINYQNYEIIVVDNASTDASAEWLEKHATEKEGLHTCHPGESRDPGFFKFDSESGINRKVVKTRFCLIKNKKNLGFAKANNMAIAKASGEYLLFLNNDTKVDTEILKNLTQKMEENLQNGICACQMRSYDSQEHYHTGIGLDMLGYPVNRELMRMTTRINANNKVFYAEGSALMIRHDLFKKLNGFDEKYFMFHEDIDLAWRAWLLGYKVVAEPKAVVYHLMGASIGSGTQNGKYFTTFKRRYLSERNNLRTLLKNYSFKNLFFILLVYFLINLIEIIYFLIKGKFNLAVTYLKSWYWNLINLADTLKARKKIQATRKVTDKYILNKMSKKIGKLQALKNVKL